MTKTQQRALSFTLSWILCAAAFFIETAGGAEDPLARARALLSRHPVVDGHNDVPWAIREYAEAPRDVEAYDLRRRAPGQTDLERLRQGGVGGQF